MAVLASPLMLARAADASPAAGRGQTSCSLRRAAPRRVLLRAAAPRLLRQRGTVRVAASKVGAPGPHDAAHGDIPPPPPPPPPAASAAAAAAHAAPPTTSAAALAAQEEEFEDDVLDGVITGAPEPAPLSIASIAVSVVQQPVVKATLITGGTVLLGTLLFSIYKVYLRFNSKKSKRRRQVGKNVAVVEELASYLPARRAALNRGVVRGLALRTGFSADVIFRKQLRYILNERPFDADAVADVLALRAACGLEDAALADVLSETATRSFKKTGILMRRPKGLTAEGLARKAQGRALFSKLLFLCELEGLLPEAARDAAVVQLKATFGATSDDTDALRIPSLQALDGDALERLWAAEATSPADAAAPAAPAEKFDDAEEDD